MTGLIGKPRSGKTTLLHKMIAAIVKAGGRVLVVDPDGAEQSWNKYKRYQDIKDVPDNFKGVAVVYYSAKEVHGTPTFPYIQSNLDQRENDGKSGAWVNSTVVLDDSNVYARGQLEDSLEWLLMRKRQYGVDIIATGHSWAEMPPMFMRFIDVYGIGATSGTPEERIKGEALKLTEVVRNKVNTIKRNDPDKYPFMFITKDGHPFLGDI